jgi:hypothetical protein
MINKTEEIIMRKLLALFVSLLIFVSCKPNPDTTVINNSDFQAIFNWSKNSDTIILDPNNVITAEYFFTDLFNLQPEKRILYKRTSSDGENLITISNLPSWEVRVNNTLAYPVTLGADGWMNDMYDIKHGDANDDNHKGIIYTDKPTFKVISNTFPNEVLYQMNDNIFYVTIR